MNENNEVVSEEQNNKSMTFDELLASNKEYQSEFDRRLAKSNNSFLETEKAKWQKEYEEKLEHEKSEAEKLAKMTMEQQLNYKIDELQKQLAEKDSKLNANDLREATSNILIEKGIPSSYLKMFDFTKESADTINAKIELLGNIRSQDLQDTLNQSLRQESPKYVKQDVEDDVDPYVEGFLSEL